MVNPSDQTVLITGASSGIGAALAQAFSAKGVKVALTARRLDRLKETAAGCSGETILLPGDVLDGDHRESLVDQCVNKWGRIDVLVNNAGMGMYGDFASSTEALWRQLFEINLFATVFLTKTVLQVMRKQQDGLIINMASIGGLIAHSSHVTPYVASKHAVVGFSRGLAKDLKGTGVRVLAVCPHLTATEFFDVAPGAREMAPQVEKYKDFMDSPQDVARGILEQLDSRKLVIFPTENPARAYEKQREL
jgi:short-subunit dehydrogenase